MSDWSQKLGPPTCRKGCANCCRFAVSASSAEAAYLIGYIQSRPSDEQNHLFGVIEGHVRQLVEHFARIGQTTNPLLEVHKLGGCPFLKNETCTIYPVRPYPCRAAHVWHDSRYCGSTAGPLRVPVELVELRDITFWETMRREVDAGRRPFWGQLTVVAYFLLLYPDSYFSGKDLRELIDLPWQETRLIQFPGDGPLDAVATHIDNTIDALRRDYSEPGRIGLLRAGMASTAADLDCDPIDKARIDLELTAPRVIN